MTAYLELWYDPTLPLSERLSLAVADYRAKWGVDANELRIDPLRGAHAPFMHDGCEVVLDPMVHDDNIRVGRVETEMAGAERAERYKRALSRPPIKMMQLRFEDVK